MSTRVLIIEDHKDSLEVLSMQLKSMGYEVIAAFTAEEGIEKAETHLPEVVLMDLGLPGLNGIEASKRLKSNPRTAHIPVIAHTAWPEEAFKDKVAEAGISGILTKPAPPYRFHATIQKHLTAKTN